MTAIADERRPPKKPPSIGMYVAALLELSIFTMLAVNKSITGCLLCLVYYFFFSATRALILEMWNDS
jgi:hypothetical protein